MSKRTSYVVAFGAGTVAVLILSAASAATPTSIRDAREEVMALSAAPMEMQVCISCIACDGSTKHVMEFLDNPETDDRGIAHPCEYGWDHTCSYHPPCEPDQLSAGEFGKLWVAVSTFEGERLQRVLAAYPEVVRYNHERRAVQFAGSCGAIIGHLPLTASQMVGLEP